MFQTCQVGLKGEAFALQAKLYKFESCTWYQVFILRDRAEVARLAHNQKVGSSNLPPATKTLWKDRENRTVGKSGIPLALGARSCGFKSRQSDQVYMDLQLEW